MMRYLVTIIALLLAAPSYGSTTTAEVLVFDNFRVDCHYTFYTGEIKDRYNQPLPPYLDDKVCVGGANDGLVCTDDLDCPDGNCALVETPAERAQRKCDSLITAVDEQRLEVEHAALYNQLPDNPNPELLQPVYPEDCVPIAPSHPAVTVEDCRRSVFHRYALTRVWTAEPFDDDNTIADYMKYVYTLVEWITGNGPGTSNWSNVEEAAWLGGNGDAITGTQRNNLRARNSNAGGAVAVFATDKANWQDCPTFEQDQQPGVEGCQP